MGMTIIDLIARNIIAKNLDKTGSINNEINKIKNQIGSIKLWHGTQFEYDNITEYNDNTLYIVNNNGVNKLYVGNNLMG